EADRWEHAISTDVEEKLVELLGDPATCPHGNPIPGSKHAEPAQQTVTLAQAPTGVVTVRRVSERLETDDEGLHLISAAHLLPRSAAKVIDSDNGTVTVTTETGEHVVPRKVADHLHVSLGS